MCDRGICRARKKCKLPFNFIYSFVFYCRFLQLKYGQDSSRSDDTSTIKKAIFEMLLEFDRGAIDLLTCKQKDNRGFNHPLTGKLLCPAKLDWDDEQCVIINLVAHMI
jgi:hypothetical protein